MFVSITVYTHRSCDLAALGEQKKLPIFLIIVKLSICIYLYTFYKYILFIYIYICRFIHISNEPCEIVKDEIQKN